MELIVCGLRQEHHEVELILTTPADNKRIWKEYDFIQKWEKEENTNMIVLPLFPSTETNDISLMAFCTELTILLNTSTFITYLLENEKCTTLSMTAIDFVVQPFPYKKVKIQRHLKMEEFESDNVVV